jgi:ERCC4-type nuclease
MTTTTPSSISLLLDTREHSLATEVSRMGVPYTTAPLDVGDILFQDSNGQPLLLIERKSHADFAASNADGRYREQRARLMAARGSGVAVLYMLEGTWTMGDTRAFGRTSETQLRRLTTRLTLRYGMPVIMSASIAETAAWCRTLLAQLQDDSTVFHPEDDMATATAAAMTSMTAALSMTKKGNKTAAGAASAMLTAIPGMGAKKVSELLQTHSVATLAAMDIPAIAAITVNGKRIGEKQATVIHDAIHALADH